MRRSVREWTYRLRGALRGVRRDADLEDELRAHLELLSEDEQRRGRAPDEASRTARVHAGGMPQAMDALRDQRGLPVLDALRSDVVFGWRQLNKHRTASAAAILSLGLAIGATTGAFRLVDAVLLRPLPVADPHRLFTVAKTFLDADKRPDFQDDFDYPTFREFARTVGDRADLMVVGLAARQPVIFGTDPQPDVVIRQFVSGNVFTSLGLQPAAGRALLPADDTTPGARPVAVISYDFWTRKFARDPDVVGTTFRAGGQPIEIVGVGPSGFTGTEPGSVTDVFLPAMMNAQAINSPGWSWFRLWVRPKLGNTRGQIQQILQARFRADHQNRLKDFPADTPKERLDAFLNEQLVLRNAGSGASDLQKTFRRPLLILTALAALVLLIACANVANLLTSQAIARSREMALRVSIGAGRGRLIQLVIVESALLAVVASAAGVLFASWSAPLVVSMLAPVERPIRLILGMDWRALGFNLALTMTVTVLFGLAPALRASAVPPVTALRGRDGPPGQPRLTRALIGAQMAFCVFLLFAAGLFIATFEHLSRRPLGFSDRHVVMVLTESRAKQPPEVWTQVREHLQRMPGVDAVSLAGWAPLSGNRWRSSVSTPGKPAEPASPYFLEISPSYFETMRIEMVGGRDFRSGDLSPGLDAQRHPVAGVGIVNEAFARVYFDGGNPVGKRVNVRQNGDTDAPLEIVGLVRNVVYDSVREPMRPTVYVPAQSRNGGALLVRTAVDPAALATILSREVPRARSDLGVRAV
ncbi:MAG TPA: ABC transporter permease, partial [Vicinamibacterales bacterium]